MPRVPEAEEHVRCRATAASRPLSIPVCLAAAFRTNGTDFQEVCWTTSSMAPQPDRVAGLSHGQTAAGERPTVHTRALLRLLLCLVLHWFVSDVIFSTQCKSQAIQTMFSTDSTAMHMATTDNNLLHTPSPMNACMHANEQTS